MRITSSRASVATIMTGLVVLVMVLVNGCASVQQAPVSSGEGGEKILVGKITEDELFHQCPIFGEQAARYVPDRMTVGKLRRVNKQTEILMFLGTWCPDSISEAPKFIKVYNTVNNSWLSLQLYGVDRAKQDGLGLTAKYDVKRVPTIIFLRDGRELGRIIEYPNKTMEEDALAILTRAQ